MALLKSTYRRHVQFNPADERHRAAYRRLRKEGKQDAELRFLLEDGYGSVLSMMQAKLADHFSEPAPAEMASIPRAERRVKP